MTDTDAAAPPNDGPGWLAKALVHSDAGHYLNMLDAAERAARIPGSHQLAAEVEALSAEVFLTRLHAVRTRYARIRSALLAGEDPRLRVRAIQMAAYGEVLAREPERARLLMAESDTLIGPGGPSEPEDRFFWLIGHSRLAQALDQPLDAVSKADRALALAEESVPESRAVAELHLGHLWLDLGFFEEAAESFLQALEVATNQARRASLHVGAALALRHSGDLQESAVHARAGIAGHRAGQRTYREANARLALAETLFELGENDEAIRQGRAAIDRFIQAESHAGEQRGALCLAKMLTASGAEPEAVLPLLNRVVDTPEGHAHHDEARVLRATLDPLHRADLATLLEEERPDAEQLAPDLALQAAEHLFALAVDSGDPTAIRHWASHRAQAARRAGARTAHRSAHLLTLRDQVRALRAETARSADLSEALSEQARLREAAEAAEAERRDLLELVAHDLRNPLSAILLMLDATDEAEDQAELLELLDLGRRAARSMRTVLDEALTASGSIGELGDVERVALGPIALDVVQRFEAGARAKGQQLLFPDEAHRDLNNTFISGVPTLIRSVFENLVSNALKFTPRGGTVVVNTSVTSDGGVRIDIADDGPGLEPGEAVTLFDRRVRGKARPTAGEPSTGLGLYLVRKVVEAHGGQVGASSPGPGDGSTFWFVLPVQTT